MTGTLVIVLAILFGGGALIPSLVSLSGATIYGFLMWLFLRGWEPARYLVVILTVVTVGMSLEEPYVSKQVALMVILPSIQALTFTSMSWVFGSAVGVICILELRADGQGMYTDPTRLAAFMTLVIGLMISRLLIDLAQRESKEHAQQNAEAQARSERQARELEQRNAELTEQNDQQLRLLNLVAALELPVIAVGDGALVAPLVGQLDQQRLDTLERRLLHEVAQQHAVSVVLDVTGVTAMNGTAAEGLLRVAQAVRLLGARTLISGINATMAQTLVGLQMPLDGLDTVRDLRQALARLGQG